MVYQANNIKSVLLFYLAPQQVSYYNSIRSDADLGDDTLFPSQCSCMLPKPYCDITSWSNFRPISLLNIDAKLLAKVLASRLITEIGDLVGKD